jgi:hypothetical protein
MYGSGQIVVLGDHNCSFVIGRSVDIRTPAFVFRFSIANP